jgi:hypothetical protein
VTGYAAFFDVLGFTALVLGDGGRRIEKYLSCLREVFDKESACPIDYVVFSDSLILTTRDSSLPALQALFARCSRMLHVMLSNNIPLRGAIACGEFNTEKTDHGTFVAGRAIIDAINFEQAQDWVGAMVAPSVVQALPSLPALCAFEDPYTPDRWRSLRTRLPWAAFVQPCSGIPFRTGGSYQGLAIVPTSGVLELAALRDSILIAMNSLNWLKSLAPDPRAQAKYDRAAMWMSDVQREWHHAAFRLEQNPDWEADEGGKGQ